MVLRVNVRPRRRILEKFRPMHGTCEPSPSASRPGPNNPHPTTPDGGSTRIMVACITATHLEPPSAPSENTSALATEIVFPARTIRPTARNDLPDAGARRLI